MEKDNRKVHLIDPSTMKIMKEYKGIKEALEGTKNNAPTVYLGVQGTQRAYELSEFREKFGVR